MAFRRRRFFGRRRGRMPVRWSGNFTDVETTTAAGATGSLTLLDVSDYRQQQTMEEGGVTLLRVRGSFCARATVVGALAHCAIFAVDENVAPAFGGALDPRLFSQFIRGDLLWHAVFMVPLAANAEPLVVPLDIKARRKLEDTSVTFVVTATAQAVTWTFSGRCLVKGG